MSISWMFLALYGLCLGTNLALTLFSYRCASQTAHARLLATELDLMQDELESIRALLKRKVGREAVALRRDRAKDNGNQVDADAVPNWQTHRDDWLKYQTAKINNRGHR